MKRIITVPSNLREIVIKISPLVLWLCMFQMYKFIPEAFKRSIDVSTLPMVETALFGGLATEFVPRSEIGGIIDLLAALAYFLHFLIPWVFGFFLWKLHGKAPLDFLWYFGWMNFLGVFTHFTFPTAPPWYNERFGFTPASYSIHGDPAGLRTTDVLLNMHFFENLYSTSPVVFGSFPSLHAAWPFMVAMYYPLKGPSNYLVWLYVAWVWWAAIYLKHHFLVDVLGGAVYVLIALNISSFLPVFISDWVSQKKKNEDYPFEIV